MEDYKVRQTGPEVQEALDQTTINKNDIAAINGKLPEEASPENPLTDKAYVDDKLSAEKTRAEGAEGTLQTAIGNEAQARQQADGVLDGKIAGNTQAIATEKTRAEGAERVLEDKITAEKTRAEGAEGSLQTAIGNEAQTRQQADQTLDGKIGANTQAISTEKTRAEGAEQALQTAIDIINGKIPAQATAHNQLADKDFVNSSISTATADFKGTYNSLQELEQVTANANDYAFVIATDAAGNTVYKRYKWVDGTGWTWEFDLNNSSFTAAQWAAIQSGITAALVTKLTDLPTNAELNQRISTAITTALAAYYTKTEIDEALQAINADITSAAGRVFFIEKSFGKYDGQREIVLQQAKAGKYVNTDGGETTASGYGISAPITLNAGDILLIPSAQAVPASVSVVARMVDRTYQKVIAYIYTYREDYPELPATATADYDASLVYTAVYDESGDTPVLTGWTRGGQTYTTLPATREVSEQFYEPLVRQAVSAMPSTGYYIYLSPTAMTVVVSGLTATVSGGTALVVGWGIFKNITTNFVGAPGQSVLAQAFAVLLAAIDGLKAQLDNLGETRAVSIDFENSPKLCGQDMYIVGNGAPASPVVPTMIGQEYLDVTNKKCYKAFSVTNSISDWVLLN